MRDPLSDRRRALVDMAFAKLDKDGNPIEDKEAEAEKAEKLEKKLSKMNWMEAKAERKKQKGQVVATAVEGAHGAGHPVG